jgi:hypothetical protein
LTARWLAESFDQGELAARVGRDGDRLVADWTGRGRLAVNGDGSDLVFEAYPGADPLDVDKLQRGAVNLLLAHLRGKIPLHASAVALGDRAVVFVAGSNLGKSTLAAVLCEQAGASLLGDDAVVIERRDDGFHVVALAERHWLDQASAGALGWTSEAAQKVPLEPRRANVKSAKLALVVHLTFSDASDEVRFVPVLGLDAVAGLLAQLTRFVVDDPAIARRDLTTLADLVDRTRIVRLERPRQLALLRSTAEAVAACALGETS